MKKVASTLVWISVFISTICLVLTILTTNAFISGRFIFKNFSNYLIFQYSMVISMFLFGIKTFIERRKDRNNKFYSFVFFMISAVTIVFILMKIY